MSGASIGAACLGFALGTVSLTFAAENPPAALPELPIEEVVLDNGMRFLLLPRPERVTVEAGWVARVGSANERPGATGLTHLLEHMLFKGSETIGARDRAAERASLAEQERLQEEIRRLYRRERRRLRAGEIDDPYDPAARPPDVVELERRFEAEAARHRALTLPGEFGRIYSEAGARGLNALTLQDMTLAFVTLPAEKLELWFWMESDRLLHPVLREFYTERRVVHEERRQRAESTPTGPFDEQLRAAFWGSHPYGWPVLGWPGDLALLSESEARRHFETFYRGGNLTAALVGRFDPAAAAALAQRYFGRLPRAEEVPEVSSLVPPARAEQRLLARCECRPQVEALYHTVPAGHRDEAALEALAGLLNGRTGRLHRSLVLEQGVAYSAYVLQSAMRWAGSFSFSGQTKGEAGPEELLGAWDRELARLAAEPIAEAELAKVRNQITADAYRRMKEPSALLLRLLMAEGFGGWRLAEEGVRRALAVGPAEVQAAVERYLRPENRTVGLYTRRGEG
jgi:predicted Zn-dependent peptidase